MDKVRAANVLRGSLLLFVFLVLFQTGHAQELSSLVGSWKSTGGNPDAGGECGASFFEGELQVYQRVSSTEEQLYDGRIHSQTTWQACDTVRIGESRVIVVVKSAEEVELHYLNSGWSPDFLNRVGDTMAGRDANGAESTWTKQQTLQVEDRIAEASFNLAKQFHDERSDYIIRRLSLFQPERANVEPEIWSMYNDSAMCVVDALRQQAVERSLPFYELLSIIDPRVGGADMELSRALDHKALADDVEACLETHENTLVENLIETFWEENPDQRF